MKCNKSERQEALVGRNIILLTNKSGMCIHISVNVSNLMATMEHCLSRYTKKKKVFFIFKFNF